MSAGSGVGQGRKQVQQLQYNCAKTTHTKNGATKKRMCSKLSAVVASANFQQKTKIWRFRSEI